MRTECHFLKLRCNESNFPKRKGCQYNLPIILFTFKNKERLKQNKLLMKSKWVYKSFYFSIILFPRERERRIESKRDQEMTRFPSLRSLPFQLLFCLISLQFITGLSLSLCLFVLKKNLSVGFQLKLCKTLLLGFSFTFSELFWNSNGNCWK